jgi:hypothetical protein
MVKMKNTKIDLLKIGYSQMEGIDFHEIFSPIVKLVSIHSMLALFPLSNLELEKLDNKMTFLYGNLDEEIYMEQPGSFFQYHKRIFVRKLKKSLYRLK